MTQEPSLTIGETFGEFLIRRLLGQGGYGAVYEAMWQKTGARVALKLLHRRHLTDQDTIGRFLREAETLGRVDHPNVVDVLTFGEHEGSPYIVLEYLEGAPLDQRTSQRKPMATVDALDIMLPVLSAVEAMHRAGIVHRDLKPGNIYLLQSANGRPRPKVLDFGLAKQVRTKPPTGITQPLVGMGTPNYMAPEQIQDAANASTRADQFSLGVLLYVLFTGRRPFEAPSDAEVVHRILGGDFVPPALQVPTMPPPIAAAISRAMHRHASERFSSLRELARVLIPFARPEIRAEMEERFSEVEDPTGGDRPLVQAKPGKRSIAPFDSVQDARRLRNTEMWRAVRWGLGVWGVLIAVATATISQAVHEELRPHASAEASTAPSLVSQSPQTLTSASPGPAAPGLVRSELRAESPASSHEPPQFPVTAPPPEPIVQPQEIAAPAPSAPTEPRPAVRTHTAAGLIRSAVAAPSTIGVRPAPPPRVRRTSGGAPASSAHPTRDSSGNLNF